MRALRHEFTKVRHKVGRYHVRAQRVEGDDEDSRFHEACLQRGVTFVDRLRVRKSRATDRDPTLSLSKGEVGFAQHLYLVARLSAVGAHQCCDLFTGLI